MARTSPGARAAKESDYIRGVIRHTCMMLLLAMNMQQGLHLHPKRLPLRMTILLGTILTMVARMIMKLSL